MNEIKKGSRADRSFEMCPLSSTSEDLMRWWVRPEYIFNQKSFIALIPPLNNLAVAPDSWISLAITARHWWKLFLQLLWGRIWRNEFNFSSEEPHASNSTNYTEAPLWSLFDGAPNTFHKSEVEETNLASHQFTQNPDKATQFHNHKYWHTNSQSFFGYFWSSEHACVVVNARGSWPRLNENQSRWKKQANRITWHIACAIPV